MNDRSRATKMAAAAAVGAVAIGLLARRRHDPAHAPGHRHLGPVPDVDAPALAPGKQARDQPWVRRSHSDSQVRRFRR
ncbi:MAG: hypothetical protein OEU32_05490 [Acidimicrobiia bacterium]|nr:hypothetical protein [Acidimicrobiia bacterium]